MQIHSPNDRTLIEQLYVRLNLKYQQKKQQNNINPILQKTDTRLISKSIANKILHSKKYKLTQMKKSSQQKSQYIFTKKGIIRTNYHPSDEEQIRHSLTQSLIQQSIKLQQLQHDSQCRGPRRCRHFATFSTDLIGHQSATKKYQNISLFPTHFSKPLRSMSAHLNDKKFKNQHPPFKFSFWNREENWTKLINKKQEKYQVKGWETTLENIQVDYGQAKAYTSY